MKFESIETSSKYIKHEDKVVEFDETDLPTPRSGFEAFFKAINVNTGASIDEFDADVLKTYKRDLT
ncbi:MAG: hypothetical protein ACXVKA_15300 [Acidimicrobiia bacterium]